MGSLAARLRAHASVPLYRRAYDLMLSGGASAGLGVLYWALASRTYSPEAVGVSSSAIAALMFLTGLGTLYLDGSLIRFVPRAGPATARLVLACYAAAIVFSVLATLVFVLGLPLWAPDLGFLGSSPGWVAAAALAVAASSVFTLEDGVLIGLRRTGWVPLENISYGVAKIVVLVAVAAGAARYGILISWVLPLVVIQPEINQLLVRLVREHRDAGVERAEPPGLRRVAAYASGNYLGFLFLLVSTRLPPVLVLDAAGRSASAYFYLPWMIASTLTLMVINVSVSLIVEGAVDQEHLAEHARAAVVHVLRLLAPVVAVLVIGAPLILQVFGARYAHEGAQLLRLLAVAAVPNALCVLAFGVARLQDRVRLIVGYEAALAALVVATGLALLGPLGIDGFGLGWLASQVAVAAVLWKLVLGPLIGGRSR